VQGGDHCTAKILRRPPHVKTFPIARWRDLRALVERELIALWIRRARLILQ
jgi:hypothetical protein